VTTFTFILALLAIILLGVVFKQILQIKEALSRIQQDQIDQQYRSEQGWTNNREKIKRLVDILSGNGKNPLPDAVVEFENIKKTLWISTTDTNLLTLAREDNILISTGCYGGGTCAQCAFTVEKGAENLSAPTEQESGTLQNLGLDDGRRLACQCKVSGNIKARLIHPIEGLPQVS